MFYIIATETFETLAMTRNEKMAVLISQTIGIPCEVRWAEQ